MNQLAYTYAATARIMTASGYSEAEIIAFLIKHQNKSGYIQSSTFPPVRKGSSKP